MLPCPALVPCPGALPWCPALRRLASPCPALLAPGSWLARGWLCPGSQTTRTLDFPIFFFSNACCCCCAVQRAGRNRCCLCLLLACCLLAACLRLLAAAAPIFPGAAPTRIPGRPPCCQPGRSPLECAAHCESVCSGPACCCCCGLPLLWRVPDPAVPVPAPALARRSVAGSPRSPPPRQQPTTSARIPTRRARGSAERRTAVLTPSL